MVELFTQLAETVYSSVSVIIILLLMFIVSVRLFFNRRKKAYLSVTLSLLIAIAQYALSIYFIVTAEKESLPAAPFILQILQITAFIFIQMGLYQLYNRTRRMDYGLLSLFLLMGVGLAVGFYPSASPDAAETPIMNTLIALDIYLFVLILLSFFIIVPHIGQTLKYRMALWTYLIMHAASTLNRYQYDDMNVMLGASVQLLPILYYCILFLFLFDRVVEILQAVYHSSITDGLTGVYNRNFFMNRMKQYMNHGYKVSVIFSDIDNFKRLNDTRGHQTGDKVLQKVAQIMKEEAEDIGIAGRYGGEEMLLLVTDPRVNVPQLAETIRRRVEEETPSTVSIGFSTSRKGTSPEQVVKQADEAMYHSKQTGKNRVTAHADIRDSKRPRSAN